MSDKNIYQRLLEVAKEVLYVKKDTESGSGGKGVARDLVIAVTRPVFLRHGILVSTSQVAPATVTFTPRSGDKSAKVTFVAMYATSFINVDKPEDRFVVQHEGQGDDYGDKAPGKASTYAEKLNIIKALALETGIKDEGRLPEDGGGEDEAAPDAGVGVDALDRMVAELQGAKTKEEMTALYKSGVAILNTKGTAPEKKIFNEAARASPFAGKSAEKAAA